ncbi:MAG: hypothetical protein COA88_11505 [Kordia sp.]|nr:MAG: hypothetical protein COA88_11505 [Kordia sp.]
MRKITILLLLIATISFAQKKKKNWADDFVVSEKPTIPVEEIKGFLKAGQYIITYEAGDFNGDKLIDAILVVGDLDEVSSYRSDTVKSKRSVIILRRNDFGVLEKTLENEDIVYCYTCNSPQGSPLTSVVFSGNTFAVEHEAGKVNRWTRIITFEYDREKQLWLLLKDASSTYNIMNSKGFTSNVKTQDDFGFIYFENYDAFSEDLTKQTKH